jgi:hypothetical protein
MESPNSIDPIDGKGPDYIYVPLPTASESEPELPGPTRVKQSNEASQWLLAGLMAALILPVAVFAAFQAYTTFEKSQEEAYPTLLSTPYGAEPQAKVEINENPTFRPASIPPRATLQTPPPPDSGSDQPIAKNEERGGKNREAAALREGRGSESGEASPVAKTQPSPSKEISSAS